MQGSELHCRRSSPPQATHPSHLHTTAGRGVIRTVGEEIDRLESELKAMVPGLVYVDLETDKGRAEKAMAQASIAVMAPLSTVLRPTDPEAP